jgi:hypothetical protein
MRLLIKLFHRFSASIFGLLLSLFQSFSKLEFMITFLEARLNHPLGGGPAFNTTNMVFRFII